MTRQCDPAVSPTYAPANRSGVYGYGRSQPRGPNDWPEQTRRGNDAGCEEIELIVHKRLWAGDLRKSRRGRRRLPPRRGA